jgi:hypothetical protein
LQLLPIKKLYLAGLHSNRLLGFMLKSLYGRMPSFDRAAVMITFSYGFLPAGIPWQLPEAVPYRYSVPF